MNRWFLNRGFDVDQAGNGLEAVKLCDQKKYDVITMDLEMPEMGGLEAIAHIRVHLPDVPILVITGFSSNAGTAMEGGATAVLTKPLRLQDLEEHILRLLEKNRASKEPLLP